MYERALVYTIGYLLNLSKIIHIIVLVMYSWSIRLVGLDSIVRGVSCTATTLSAIFNLLLHVLMYSHFQFHHKSCLSCGYSISIHCLYCTFCSIVKWFVAEIIGCFILCLFFFNLVFYYFCNFKFKQNYLKNNFFSVMWNYKKNMDSFGNRNVFVQINRNGNMMFYYFKPLLKIIISLLEPTVEG